jgi:hypothetical protein
MTLAIVLALGAAALATAWGLFGSVLLDEALKRRKERR